MEQEEQTPRREKKVIVLTLPALAAKLGIHRVTLLRLEQRGIVEAAPIVDNARVYGPKLARRIEQQVADYELRKRTGKQGVLKVDAALLGEDE